MKSQKFKTKSKKSTRWQLGEDVAGIISGQFFRRVEVDELLTPDQLHAIRAERDAQARPRRSSDTLRTISTDDSETAVEPFHLQDLPSRIGAAGVETAVPRADVVVPLDLPGLAEGPGFTLKKKSSRRKKPVTKEEYEAEANVPPPPAKNPARFLARPQAPLLPTIPEVVVTTPEIGRSLADKSNKSAERYFAPVDEDDFVFFQSTNYTLNHPAIRHGHIRFPKSEVKGKRFDPDDTLDWTAFQMAILGGRDTCSPTRPTCRNPQRMKRLPTWLPAAPPNLHISAPADSELPIPVRAEYPTGFWNEGSVNASKFSTTECGIRRWTLEGHPKRYNRESVETLPPSPMMDLVMMRDSSGEVEVVPMGYNLGHDLEDFLRWEAENVCAIGVY
ncbi:uncharacterized protein ColSpa_02024 [Colletotrichum spaethianum]|uniref:Uncharacterized protein n=1 Tax=Colletotrichum spaethianum TaxID=700344 RepID=A0AA37NZ63_9PEZI|nr:uncharacterized protein ColSpa_02024 [Colletotrichum spaethianum]GKT41843.1 hypothetical protein ColSpa_02024 [Colletotrichum spaethianum]